MMGEEREAAMGRSFRMIQTKDLGTLFSYFGIAVRQDVVQAWREEISARFALEVGEILRLCKKLQEKERFQLFREALRLAYSSVEQRHAAAGA
jgi:hypothetical protein